MANIEIKVPDIGDYTDVPVIEILVAVGDTVAKDQGLVTLESDKATMEVPASHAGVIKELKGSYQGPKNVKASGKAVGVKKKKTDKKDGAKKSATKTAPKRRANAPKAAPLVSQDGMAPLKRKKPAAE